MKTWYEITAGVLIVGALLVFLGASLCACGSETKESRRAEGEQLLGSARDDLRVQRSILKKQPDPSKPFDDPANFQGQHFQVLPSFYPEKWPAHTDTPMFRDGPTAIVASPVNPADGWGVMYFDWNTGRSYTEWFDSKPAFVDESSSSAGGPSR